MKIQLYDRDGKLLAEGADMALVKFCGMPLLKLEPRIVAAGQPDVLYNPSVVAHYQIYKDEK